MPTVRVTLPLYLPQWLYEPLQGLKHMLFPVRSSNRNIGGDRQIEWTFLGSRMPEGPGEALEFGCESAFLSLLAARKGFHVVALDLQPQGLPWREERVTFVQGDLFEVRLPENSFDLIINCSSIEHVGLAGRYGIAEQQPEGDLKAMHRLRSLLKPDGMMLLSVPCGRDSVFAPLHRVYGYSRLPRLLEAFSTEEEAYWVKDGENRWTACDKETALTSEASVESYDPVSCVYALGCFVLRGSESKC